MTPLVKDIIMSSTRMPALFLGHGSPMNVLEDNLYTRSWQTLGMTLPRPQAIVVASRRRCTIRIILLRVHLRWHSIWLSC